MHRARPLHLLTAAVAFLAVESGAAAQEAGGQPDWIVLARLEAAKRGISVGEAVRRAALLKRCSALTSASLTTLTTPEP